MCTDDVRSQQTRIEAACAVDGKRCAGIEHGLDIAFTVEVECRNRAKSWISLSLLVSGMGRKRT